MGLWEADHAYYCSEGNYFSTGCCTEYKTWGDFIENEGDSDPDMNLVFRFDWNEGGMGGSEYTGDDYYRNGLLQLCFMGQRKGLYRSVLIEVCRADEPSVRGWLQPRFDYLVALWAPLTPNTPE